MMNTLNLNNEVSTNLHAGDNNDKREDCFNYFSTFMYKLKRGGQSR